MTKTYELDLKDIEVEDSGCAVIITAQDKTDKSENGTYITLCSWDDNRQHKDLVRMLKCSDIPEIAADENDERIIKNILRKGKKLTITIS